MQVRPIQRTPPRSVRHKKTRLTFLEDVEYECQYTLLDSSWTGNSRHNRDGTENVGLSVGQLADDQTSELLNIWKTLSEDARRSALDLLRAGMVRDQPGPPR